MSTSMMKGVARKAATKAVKAHERRMHKKSMKAGGPTSLDMKNYGRGMAKVMNQRQSVRGR